MITWTPDDITRAKAIAEAAGCPHLYAIDLVPDGAEPYDAVSVLYRGFTPAELATHLDAPSTVIADRNAAMGIILSVDGAWGKEIPAKVHWLSDLGDGFLSRILSDAGQHLGLYDAGRIQWARVKPSSSEEDLEPYDLSKADAAALLAKYRDPGQLRAVRAGDVPPFVLRRPKADEMRFSGKGTSAISTDLLLACIVKPASIEERRAIVERWPGLGAALLPMLNAMRNGGVIDEKKGQPTYGRAVAL